MLNGLDFSYEAVKHRPGELGNDESEILHAKYLLIRLRNEEMNLRQSAFGQDKKGLDNFLFEANSSQHRQGVRME